MKKCYAKSYCRLYSSNDCNSSCSLYSLLNAIYKLTNLPKRYRYDIPLYPAKNDMEAFKALNNYKGNIEENIEQGKHIYIWGKNTGNGKTSWATKLANHYIRKKAIQGRLDKIVLYVNIPTYLNELRASFNTDTQKIEEINEQLREADLVIFDDIGAEKISEWVQERLYTIINYRENNLKSNIFTSNLSPSEVKSILGDRLYSRMVASSLIIELKGGDNRCMNNK